MEKVVSRPGSTEHILARPLVDSFVRVHGADDGELMHHLGGAWKQFRDMNARNGSRNGFEAAPYVGGSLRLGIEGVELAGAAVLEQNNARNLTFSAIGGQQI